MPETDERLSRAGVLRRRSEYQNCYRQGKRRHGQFVTLHIAANQVGHTRLGITATRKVGGSVVRHLLKRRVREIYRRWPERLRLPAVDLVVHLKPVSGKADFSSLQEDLLILLSGGLVRGAKAPR